MTKKIVNKAFSLIDFAIWITIFSVMVIGFLAISSAQNKHKNFVADNLEKQLIQNKIKAYVLKEISHNTNINNNNIILHKSCNDAGESSTQSCLDNDAGESSTQSCLDFDKLKNITGAIKDNIGCVPYKTLGLNQEDAIDSNNKFYLFLAHRIDSQSQYQYYVFSQTEEVIDIEKIIDSENVKNQNQNTIMPTQIPNCHIAVTKIGNNYIDILSGGSKKTVYCQDYNTANITYKNNANRASPSDNPIDFECFSGNNDYGPQEKCERVCTTFSAGGATYNISPQFLNGTTEIGPNNYGNIYTALKISTSSILRLKCNENNENYVYQVDSAVSCIANALLSDDGKSCQCDSASYYVQNGTANECVKGCKMSLDVVGPGTMANREKLYYPGQPVSDVFADIEQCNDNAIKNSFFTTEQIYLHPNDNKSCILRKKRVAENFKQKLCSCNSGYSMLANNSIANFFSSTAAFMNFPGDKNINSAASTRNFDAKYDCFKMCSATPSNESQIKLINTVDSKVIGYHSSDPTTTPTIITNLNSIAFRVGTTTASDSYLFYDGTQQQQLQPLDCSKATGTNVDYCLEVTNTKRLFSSKCSNANLMGNSLPSLQIQSGGSF